MATCSYAMYWREGNGPQVAGRIQVDLDAVNLDATVPPGATQRVRFRDIVQIVLERGMLRLDRKALPSFRIGSLDRPGTLRELADCLAEGAADARLHKL